jgi:adenosylmethionine---8-amino-7-oxononanoate aminotransferase
MSGMDDLQKIDHELIWHPFTSFNDLVAPVFIESAEGIYLHTKDGRKIIDAVSSWWVNLHGHSNKHIAEAIAQQAFKLEHVIFAGFTHQPAITLAANLMKILPENQAKIFFSDNGSTAVEVALKMAFQFWYNQGIKKNKIVALKGAYHGDTFGAMSVGERSIFSDPFFPYLFEVEFIDFPDEANEESTINQFRIILSTNEVGAFIFEPLVQGASGMRLYSPSVLNSLIVEAKKNNVICIADEVFTGFGRTGRTFACNYLNEMPDIMAVSKGITGGAMALGVTSCSQKIVSAFTTPDFTKTFFHGHSYTANPIACSAANASFELLMKPECSDQIKMIASSHYNFMLKIQNHRSIKDVRCIGTILAIELNTGDETSYSNELRKTIYPFFMDRNILLRPLGNTIYVLPPYVIHESELKVIYDCIEEFVAVL